MTSLASICRALSLSLGALFLSTASQAQIVVGQSSGFTGPVSAGVKENSDGAKLYIDHVNATGGVAGQRIELVSLDDKFDPKLTVVNARKLITEHKAIALFLIRGTPHTQAVMPLLEEFKVPLVAPSTGAMLLHKPVNPWIFNVRATYQRESEKAVTHLATIGLTRIALVHVDDTFGEDCATGARKGFEAAKLEPLFVEKFDRVKSDFSVIAKKAASMEAQAVMFIGSAGAVSEGTKVIRNAGSRAQIVTVSNNASGGFIKMLGEHSRGVIVTQIFPYERSLSAPMVKEAFDLARAKGMTEVTPAMLEGYAGAKVLVEGLRRAGASPTRASLRQAMETFRKVDIGGLEVTYTAGNHSGLDYADLSIIGQDGKFRR
ncbi:ABC transporter substrate-binding protein [Piscinibacter sp.]|uniref:ABC transporter substrate-binding protein n=1 Tax=Piscinibacter sp. TaxID=1903157 RepID=UPI002C48C855|nr:ABC transporter substrate-binding protein [Albitalea sp.]HUG24558.1 ABC transporter substrate-binding protein [Albitalea sp.]